MTPLPDRVAGALLVAAACLCWSSGSILVRLLDLEAIVIVFWRSLFMAPAVALGLLVVHRSQGPAVIAAVRWPGLLSGFLLSGAFIGYILSVSFTHVANAMILMSATPLVAAMLAWLLLKERPNPAMILAIGAAMVGIAVMFSHGIAAGSLLSESFALRAAFAFGANIVVLRRWRGIDMVPAAMLGGLISAAVAAPWAIETLVAGADFMILATLGCFQLGLGLFQFVHGSRKLRAAELGLLTLLEPILAPVWVRIGIGETPSAAALLGGSIVLMAVVGLTVSEHLRPLPITAVKQGP